MTLVILVGASIAILIGAGRRPAPVPVRRPSRARE
jgi:hypothetical protein